MRTIILGTVAAIAATFSSHAYAYTGRPTADLGRSISLSSSIPAGSGTVLVQQRGDSSPMVVSPGGNVPQTGSQQGVDTPNAAPRTGTQSRSPSNSERMVVAPSGPKAMMPTTGSEGEPESHNSMPMPRSAGPAMGAQSAPDVMVTAPPEAQRMPSSGSAGEPESHNSMPMPRSAPTPR